MQHISADRLTALVQRTFVAAGTPDDLAAIVTHSLVLSNLVGHDSHGVQHVPSYLKQIREGRIKPAGRPSILEETETTALVSGNWGYGQVTIQFAADLAIQKARRMNLAAVGVVEQNHTGRMGEFAEQIAEAGLVGIVVVGGSRTYEMVAPFGGRTRVLATNPYAFGVPAGSRPPLVVDFATSVIAGGKLDVARAKGTALPPGSLVDAEGRPSTDVEDYFRGGALLPFGGHKGYALALVAEMLASVMIGADRFGGGPGEYGTWIQALDPAPFRSQQGYREAADTVLDLVASAPPAEGFSEVLLPGDPERRERERRERDGIPMPDQTWQSLLDAAASLGIS